MASTGDRSSKKKAFYSKQRQTAMANESKDKSGKAARTESSIYEKLAAGRTKEGLKKGDDIGSFVDRSYDANNQRKYANTQMNKSAKKNNLGGHRGK